MAAENNLKANMQGDGQEQPTPNTPLLQQQGQSHGYPQYGPSKYAPPSGAGYGVPPSQHVIVVRTVEPVVYAQPAESFVGAVIYSCIVCWCFCPFFGLIGFMLAMCASDTVATDVQGARKLGRASYIVSTLGVVVAFIIVCVYFGIFYGSCSHFYDGVCYRYFSSDMTFDECLAKDGVYDEGCYYN